MIGDVGQNSGTSATQGTVKPTVIGWLVFLFGLYFLNKSQTGHTLIFWGLMLIAIYLLVGNYRRIVPLLEK
jgi:hypothetical protein